MRREDHLRQILIQSERISHRRKDEWERSVEESNPEGGNVDKNEGPDCVPIDPLIESIRDRHSQQDKIHELPTKIVLQCGTKFITSFLSIPHLVSPISLVQTNFSAPFSSFSYLIEVSIRASNPLRRMLIGRRVTELETDHH